jgi:hypothetical protein
MLLLRTKGRSLAALGAAITLFALAMDPFFQQVVGLPEQWRVQPTKGFISRATTYKTYTAGKYLNTGQVVLELDQSMTATAYHYFYDNGTGPITASNGAGSRPTIPLSCPNSNCTWTEYDSLGVCNRCADITDRLEFQCLESVLDWIDAPNPTLDSTGWMYPNGTACGWYLKSDNPMLMSGYTTDLFTNHTGEVLLSRSQPLYDLLTRAPLPGYQAKLNDTRNPITHFIVVSGQDVEKIRRNSTPIAHECIISVRNTSRRVKCLVSM